MTLAVVELAHLFMKKRHRWDLNLLGTTFANSDEQESSRICSYRRSKWLTSQQTVVVTVSPASQQHPNDERETGNHA